MPCYARLILLAEYISAQLLKVPELTSPQQANVGVVKSLSSLDSYQAVASPHPPLLVTTLQLHSSSACRLASRWSGCLVAPAKQRHPPNCPYFVAMVYGILIFSVCFAVRRYV